MSKELRLAAEWLVKVHADDKTIRGTALWEDLQALRAALAADQGLRADVAAPLHRAQVAIAEARAALKEME